MGDLVNALNGGKVQLWADTGSGYVFIGGQTAHSKTSTFEPIDISNKAAPDERCYLEGEGKQTDEVSAEILWSSDAAFQFVIGKSDAKLSFPLEIRYGGLVDKNRRFDALVTVNSDTAGQNAAVSNSVTLSSTGALNWRAYSLRLDFTNDVYYIDTGTGGELVPFADIVTFTRATEETYFNKDGVLTTAAIDEPIFAYDPSTLDPLGLQVFGAATNLLTYSEQFDNAAWAKNGSTISADSASAPDAAATADKFTPSSGQSAASVGQSSAVAIGLQHVFSIFAKNAGQSLLSIVSDAVTSFKVAVIDVDSCTVQEAPPEWSIVVTATDNGWCKISVTLTPTTSSANFQVSNNSAGWVGDGTSGLYIWGAQLETGSIATPYIKTEASQVTRAADIATVDDLSGWYNQSQGSVFVEAMTNKASTAGIIELDDDYFDIRFGGGKVQVFSSTTMITQSPGLSYTAGEMAKIAATVTSYSIVALNGDIHTNVNPLIVSSASKMQIGRIDNNLSNPLNGYIKTLNYYPSALTENEQKAITK